MTETPIGEKQIGRNEPCPCGSGKKYKRCCGVGAAPKLSAATPGFAPGALPGGGSLEQFKDQMDPQAMQQFSQMLGRLPKGQLQKLQNIMQRAMAGKDVTREAQEFEHTLPTELQSMLHSMQMPQQAPETSPMAPSGMNEEEARRIVEAAAQEGKISADEASELLQPKGISKLWKKISGK